MAYAADPYNEDRVYLGNVPELQNVGLTPTQVPDEEPYLPVHQYEQADDPILHPTAMGNDPSNAGMVGSEDGGAGMG